MKGEADPADLRTALYADRVKFLRREVAQTILERFMARTPAEREQALAHERRLRVMVQGAEAAYEEARKGRPATPLAQTPFL